MVFCYLCLKNRGRKIGIFSDEGIKLNISSTISKHFWLQPDDEKQSVCENCWSVLKEFHEFYQEIADAHKRLESLDLDSIVSLEDPLPDDNLLKSEEDVASAGQLVEALGESFFDSEVKVEVHDLDLLPRVEVIEDVEDCIKEELVPSGTDMEIEFPLDMLVGNTSELENQQIIVPVTEKDAVDHLEDESSCLEEKTVPRKRRGRPRKCNSTSLKLSKNDKKESTELNAAISIADCTDTESEDDRLAADCTVAAAGTDDSASSSSESSDNESDNSLPDIEPPEKYAEIPKRVVMKPKKYRKRPKPLVPPRRMTREEIDRKNAQQAEYDKIIAQFYDKFPCALCNLFVQNFGDMKRHFRITHNIDPGYVNCCGRKFHLRKTLAEHVFVHWNPEHFKCATCSRIFQDSRSLEVHELTHTNPPEPKERKIFQCDKCPKNFTTKAAFEHHSYSKHVPKSEFKFTCVECNKKLPTARKLKDHMKYLHDPESAIICDKCGKQVRSQSNLKKHHATEHSDVPRPAPVPVQCNICGTWLRHAAGLKQHMKTIHEDTGGEHRCQICNKTSTNARALKRHIYHNHLCERKFKCTMCEKAFKRPQDLREHTSTHTGEVLYTCPNCPMTFFSNANMYKHRQRLHRAEWEADRKKPGTPIMQQAVAATAAMKMQQAVGSASAFFAQKLNTAQTSHLQMHKQLL